jgi:trans-L-3-hydroxyproline dehydratase
VSSVRFRNVPAFLAERDVPLRPDGLALSGGAAEHGALSVDIAFGGAYYAIVQAADLGLRVTPSDAARLRDAGAAITELVRRDHSPTHPADPDLGFVYGTIIVDGEPASAPDGRARDADVRNVAIFADAEVDRSPCGSGTSAILAQRFERGGIAEGQPLRNASITGEVFIGRVEGRTQVGGMPAVETSVEGTAYVTGYGSFVVDERDPLGDGFLLG